MAAILRLESVQKHFGGIRAVDSVSVEVEKGTLVGLIGPNGSGKSTLFNLISGVQRPDAGRILFRDEDITGEDSDAIFAKGLVRSFQNPRLFLGMSVLENAMVPPRGQIGEKVLNAPRHTMWHDQEVDLAKKALGRLARHQLAAVRSNWSTDISGGQMKLLEVARAAMGEPRMMLLDEPTAGVAPKLAREIFDAIAEMRATLGVTLLVIEHRLDVLFDYAERVLVMHGGKVLFDGSPSAAGEDERVIEAYLGA